MKLRNLGFASLAMLEQAGIHSIAQLHQLGSVAAYIAVKKSGAKPGLNLLWALEGALTDQHWQDVAQNERLRLLLQLETEESQPT